MRHAASGFIYSKKPARLISALASQATQFCCAKFFSFVLFFSLSLLWRFREPANIPRKNLCFFPSHSASLIFTKVGRTGFDRNCFLYDQNNFWFFIRAPIKIFSLSFASVYLSELFVKLLCSFALCRGLYIGWATYICTDSTQKTSQDLYFSRK